MALEFIPVIHRITHQIGLAISETESLGLTQGEAHVLAFLHNGDATISALHREFAHKRSTLTSILDRLEERGLITREVSAEDRRSFLVSLTRPGRGVAVRALRRLEELEAIMTAELPVRDREQAVKLLRKLEAAIRAHH